MINKTHKAEIRRRVEDIVYPAITRDNAAGGVNRLRFTVVDGILKLTEELEKAYGNCQFCYGKGYSTTHQGLHNFSEFSDVPTTKILFCDCHRGSALKKVWGKPEGVPW